MRPMRRSVDHLPDSESLSRVPARPPTLSRAWFSALTAAERCKCFSPPSQRPIAPSSSRVSTSQGVPESTLSPKAQSETSAPESRSPGQAQRARTISPIDEYPAWLPASGEPQRRSPANQFAVDLCEFARLRANTRHARLLATSRVAHDVDSSWRENQSPRQKECEPPNRAKPTRDDNRRDVSRPRQVYLECPTAPPDNQHDRSSREADRSRESAPAGPSIASVSCSMSSAMRRTKGSILVARVGSEFLCTPMSDRCCC